MCAEECEGYREHAPMRKASLVVTSSINTRSEPEQDSEEEVVRADEIFSCVSEREREDRESIGTSRADTSGALALMLHEM